MNFNSFIYKIPKRKLKKNITSLIFCGTHIYGSTEVGIYKRKILKKHDLDQENKKENKILIKKTRKKTRS